MRETNKRENSLSVLAECEQYVKQIIFVNSFISTSIRMLMVYISGIYLKQDLDASPFMIGIAGFFITGCSVLRFYAMPILTFYVSYDYNTTLRHAIQIIICLFMAIWQSPIGLLICGALNGLFTVSVETTFGVITLLLPTESSMQHRQLATIMDQIACFTGALLVPIALSFFSFAMMFYTIAAIYACQFVFNLMFIADKEWRLLHKQMKAFDEPFLVEKVRRRLSATQRYRTSMTLDYSIMKFLNDRCISETAAPETEEPEQSSNTSTDDLDDHEMLENGIIIPDVPEVMEKAKKVVTFPVQMMEAKRITHTDKPSKNVKQRTALTTKEWCILYSMLLVFPCIKIGTYVSAHWLLIYLTVRYEHHSDWLSALVVAMLTLGSFCGVLCYPTLSQSLGTHMFGNAYFLRTKQKILVHCSVLMLASVASVVLALWVVTSSFYLGFLAVFVNGFLTIGCPPIVCEVLILVFKIDLDDDSIGKLIGILQAISSLVASLTVFGVGVIWHLSADVVVYVLIANGLVIAMLGLLIVVVTSTFQGTQPFKIGDGSNNDAHYQAITKEKSNETVAMST
eukprot:158574_1